ncbi:hypothetical protein [Hyalangium gracile]|uniref:hypothetical protein n=1 Tax=Hyalangium gracile TaxID=394092 RepID=UPI001CCC75E9|nr:hypothetical protein [Hyalangium gracile]
MLRLSRSRRLLTALLVTGLAPVAVAEQPSSTPNYAGYTAARFIPYANAETNVPAFTHALEFNLSVEGKPACGAAPSGATKDPAKPCLVTMDTGTTGIMVSAADLAGYSAKAAEKYPLGREFLSSSKLLWVGRWIPKNVTFHDAKGAPLATATVPVLVVEKEATCPQYNEQTDKETCPGTPLKPAKPGIFYMGVGFGREHDGQPQGTPDKNPFLHITQINGAPVAKGTMRSGYIITEKGVHVGLTSENAGGFAFTQLTGPKYSKDPQDWPEASICVAVDQSPCIPAKVLIDTGIPQMYLTVTSEVPVQTVLAPDLSSPKRQVPVLKDGSQVTVRFPGNDHPMAFYTFKVGDKGSDMQPAQVITTKNGKNAFVNTGRHFLRNFNVLYDAEGGLFGLRWVGPANSPYGGLTPTR